MGLVIWDALTLVKSMFFVVVLVREGGWGAPQRAEFRCVENESNQNVKPGPVRLMEISRGT